MCMCQWLHRKGYPLLLDLGCKITLYINCKYVYMYDLYIHRQEVITTFVLHVI